jgi:hypothetical protein
MEQPLRQVVLNADMACLAVQCAEQSPGRRSKCVKFENMAEGMRPAPCVSETHENLA